MFTITEFIHYQHYQQLHYQVMCLCTNMCGMCVALFRVLVGIVGMHANHIMSMFCSTIPWAIAGPVFGGVIGGIIFLLLILIIVIILVITLRNKGKFTTY